MLSRKELTPLELLLQEPVDHVPAPDVQGAHIAALRSAIRADGDSLLASPLSGPRRGRRTRVRAVVIGTAALVAMAGAGLAAAAARLSPTDTTTVRCFAVVTSDLDDDALAQDVGSASDGGAFTSAALARDLCAAAWSVGSLSPMEPHVVAVEPGGTSAPVPELVACVLPDGRVGVFPGAGDICAALGLSGNDEG